MMSNANSRIKDYAEHYKNKCEQLEQDKADMLDQLKKERDYHFEAFREENPELDALIARMEG